MIYQGDCLDILPTLDAESVDSIVTDPPYGLSFMGKDWDHGVPGVHFWVEALRVAKPGAYLLAFGGTRTFHRLAVAIEDAGWEIRDCVMWVYGSGFPKSADVSKMLDKQERNKWLNISKAIDNMPKMVILEAWKEYSKAVKLAGIQFQKSEIETGIVTQKNDSVPAPVLLSINPERLNAPAIIAELSLNEAPPLCAENGNIVPISAGENKRQDLARFAELPPQNDQAKPMLIGIAQCDAKELQNEKTAEITKAEEALMIWLGKTKSSEKQDTAVLCAALTENLKLIILNQSKTFQNLDMIRQMEIVSATTAIITESTAENLISSTANTLKNKAIDKAAGAEREKVLVPTKLGNTRGDRGISYAGESFSGFTDISAPATDAARQWEGWGTSLKPAWEPIIVARKPIVGTVAANVLKYGTGAINIDGCRVDTFQPGELDRLKARADTPRQDFTGGRLHSGAEYTPKIIESGMSNKGRWPANIIHDGSQEVLELFPKKVGGQGGGCHGKIFGNGKESKFEGYHDSGSAARFFYCAKASRAEREMGMEGQLDGQPIRWNKAGKWTNDTTPAKNNHPTVKPIKLMRYLCKLVTPPGGIILDPFMGSGSTGKAALMEGFRFIGIELEKEYAEIAERRISVEQPLFHGVCA